MRGCARWKTAIHPTIFFRRCEHTEGGTKEFAQAVVDRIGKLRRSSSCGLQAARTAEHRLGGVDIAKPKKEMVAWTVLDWTEGSAEQLGQKLESFPVTI